jgi:hypothetical protein
MRRWLITLFAFHFLVSVGLFAPLAAEAGAVPQPVAVERAPQVAAAASPAPDAPLNTLLLADHGVNEVQSEMPEGLPLVTVAQPTLLRSVARHAFALLALSKPVLEGPQRPPRPQPI